MPGDSQFARDNYEVLNESIQYSVLGDLTRMADTTHLQGSPTAVQTSAGRRRRWLVYLVGVPIIGVIYHFAYLQLLYEAVAIGDTAHPVLSPLHGVALTILNFPMMYLWFPIGEWLKPHLTDDGVISLFAKINALVWGFLVIWLASFIIQRSRKRRRS